MLQQNFYPGKAIQVWGVGDGGTKSSLDADIPNPSFLVSELTSDTSSGAGNQLIDASATFQDDLDANKFAIGDTVYQTKTFKHSRIISVDSQTQLTVFDTTFFPTPFAAIVSYQIYRQSPIGCVVWYFNDRITNTPIADVTDMNNNLQAIGHLEIGTTMIPFQCRKFVHPGIVAPSNYAFAMFQ
jgi:hypothetical protein